MLQTFADWVVYRLCGLAPGTHLGDALHFFVYDTIKIFFLLAVIIFLISYLRSYFPPEKARQILSKYPEFVGNIMAALLGIVTPFCSCSAVPLFIGFIEAGIPLGVTFSFLISSPMVNEVALVMLWGMFGWKIAIIYIITGVVIAIICGLVIGRLGLEHLVEEYVYEIRMGETASEKLDQRQRINYAKQYVLDILKKIWAYVLLGIALGGFIHGYVPADFMVKYAGSGNPFAVPLAVVMGIPLYSNAAGTIPIVQALMEKGVPLGTALAFMMAITGISLPEMIILRNVLKVKMLAIYAGIMFVAITCVGYLFNFIM